MQFFGTPFGSAAHTVSYFVLVLALFLSHLPTLSVAAPKPIPEAAAAAIAEPSEVPGDTGIAVLHEGSGPVVPFPGSDDKNETGSTIEARAPPFCFAGWDQRNYVGNWAVACCYYACCNFSHDILNNRLFSAKATYSDSNGVYLYTGRGCTGNRLWVDFAGWWNLAQAPAYYSMSQ